MIGLIACAKTKQSVPSPAKELYRSALFRFSKRFVERECAEWAILSAKHGLVLPDTILAPYELTLNTMRSQRRALWARRVRGQIIEKWGVSQTFLVLLGRNYLTALRGLRVVDPLKGLTYGRRLQWLKRRLEGEDG